MNQEYENIRREAIGWVKQAGQLAREYFGRASISRKADSSYITEADHAVQAALLASIARHHPADAVISEETQADPNKHASVKTVRRCWVVDPIDGTRSYARSFPGFCVSVGLMEGGWPVVGLVFNPLSGQMYSASAGGGAWLDEQPIRAQSEPVSNDILLAIPSSRRGPLAPVVHGWVDRYVVRNLGSTALHLALLGAGALDAVYADQCHLWDIAAGELIAREGGAAVVSLKGKPYFPMDLANYTNAETPFLAARPATLAHFLAEYRHP